MLAWLRQNVIAGVVTGIITTAVLTAITGVWALPMRVGEVEAKAEDNRRHHDAEITAVRARHETDIRGVDVHLAASDRTSDRVIQMLETVQHQVASVQKYVELNTELEARRLAISARENSATSGEGD